MSFLNRLTLVSLFAIVGLTFVTASSSVYAGDEITEDGKYYKRSCNSLGDLCNSDLDCHRKENCADCVTCEVDPMNPTISRCVANDLLCQNMSGGDESNDCRVGQCNAYALAHERGYYGEHEDTSGCEIKDPAILDPYDHEGDNFDVPCYECDDAKPEVACGNGICNANIGENGTTCPIDCLEAGASEAITDQEVLDAQCNLLIPKYPVCDDFDRSTYEECVKDPFDRFHYICKVTPTEPSGDKSDLVCALGAEGPKAPMDKKYDDGSRMLKFDDGYGYRTCKRSDLGPWCDIDCWPGNLKAECGDPYVEPGETCDDGLVTPTAAGTGPNGTIISKAACRDPGTQGECTACGDGVVQPLVEQCDFAAPAGENGCTGGEACQFDCTCADADGGDGSTTTTTTTTTGGSTAATTDSADDGTLDAGDTFGPIVDENGSTTGTSATGGVQGSGCSLGNVASSSAGLMSLALFAMAFLGTAWARARSKK